MNKEQVNGRLIVAFGALALSFDVPLVKLGQAEFWSMIALRSFATFAVAIVVWGIARLFTSYRPALMPGRAAVLYGFFFGLAMLGFLAAIYHTSAANAVFIIAFNPTFCALLAWIVFKERPSVSTVIAMAIMVFGVLLIVGGGLTGGHLFGDLLAAAAALALACAITAGRMATKPLGLAPLIAAIFPGVVGLFFVTQGGYAVSSPEWILLDGLIVMPIAYWCLAVGPRYLSGAEVGMFYLLETVLAPVWLWLIFKDAPSTMTLVGGALIIAALAGHSLWQGRGTKPALLSDDPLQPAPATGSSHDSGDVKADS